MRFSLLVRGAHLAMTLGESGPCHAPPSRLACVQQVLDGSQNIRRHVRLRHEAIWLDEHFKRAIGDAARFRFLL